MNIKRKDKLKLKIKKLFFLTGRPVCMIHEKTAKEMSLHVGNRVVITSKNNKIISIVDTVKGIIKPDEIAVSEEILQSLNLKDKETVDVSLTERPISVSFIKKKLSGEVLSKDEINEIIKDISNNALTEVEVAFFVSAVYSEGMSEKETKNLIDSMVNSGKKIKLQGKVADKHCIGGIAGNRTTPIVVSICAAAGLVIPKTSSRAITSAAGTADVMETIANVNFSIDKIKRIIKKTNACLVWGGALGLAPVDDKIIKIERMINIDSTPQLLASILSKKISVGSHYVLIDIPFGKSAKVSKNKAEKLKQQFLKIGKMFNLELDVALTDGSEPIGNGVGPALEIADVINVLKRENSPKDLEEKSIMLSGKLLELSGIAKKSNGEGIAREILQSGKAFEKFSQIVKAQNGKVEKLPFGKFCFEVLSSKNARINHFDNHLINKIARFAGCPEDHLAGIYLHKKKGDTLKKGETIMTIYAESKEKLESAKGLYERLKKDVVEFKH
jgi:AMP phosphorylase